MTQRYLIRYLATLHAGERVKHCTTTPESIESAAEQTQDIRLGLYQEQVDQRRLEVPPQRYRSEILVKVWHHAARHQVGAAQFVLHRDRGQQRNTVGVTPPAHGRSSAMK
jgi:hypothetical protein